VEFLYTLQEKLEGGATLKSIGALEPNSISAALLKLAFLKE